MMHIIKKWKIEAFFVEEKESITIYINDDHYSNMLRKLLEFGFENDPIRIEINVV